MHILVAVASRHGSTLEIAETVAAVLRARGFEVTVASPSAVADPAGYDAVVLGSAVYAGHWLEPAAAFVHGHAEELRGRPVWLFSSGPLGDPGTSLERRMAAVSPGVELAQACGAREHRAFGGKLARDDLSPLQRLGTRVVGGLVGDWRPWEEIQAWAGAIADQLAHAEWIRRLGEETVGAAPAERRDRS